jgi:acyl carrier protein
MAQAVPSFSSFIANWREDVVNQQIETSLEQTTRIVIAEVLGISPDKIGANATLAGDLRVTSVDMLEILMALEDAFDVEISDRDAATVVRVEDLEVLVRRRQALGPAAEKPALPAIGPD